MCLISAHLGLSVREGLSLVTFLHKQNLAMLLNLWPFISSGEKKPQTTLAENVSEVMWEVVFGSISVGQSAVKLGNNVRVFGSPKFYRFLNTPMCTFVGMNTSFFFLQRSLVHKPCHYLDPVCNFLWICSVDDKLPFLSLKLLKLRVWLWDVLEQCSVA